MSVNSSSNSSLRHLDLICYDSRVAWDVFLAYTCTSFLLVPLFVLILYLGHQQWRQQRSMSAETTTSHCDVFTYHMVVMDLIGFLGSVLSCCGVYIDVPNLFLAGTLAFTIVFPGQMLFHCLTCVERYLAVVHPITYLGLRKEGGVRVRNTSIGFIWLLCFGMMVVKALYNYEVLTIPHFCLLAFSLFLISFCSLSVLYALRRLGPGEGDRERRRVDQSKQRAFHTIMVIMGVLLFKCAGAIICYAMHVSTLLEEADRCLILIVATWINLPSSLVLPLLFLHRAGKLSCCRPNVE